MRREAQSQSLVLDDRETHMSMISDVNNSLMSEVNTNLP